MAKVKKAYFCTACGYEAPKWLGKCPACGEWNTFAEEVVSRGDEKPAPGFARAQTRPVPVGEIEEVHHRRLDTGSTEVNRVLGGGMVRGSLVLLGGEPGIGKSTLMLQICRSLGEFAKVLYVSGEESAHQLKLRAQRLHGAGVPGGERVIRREGRSKIIPLQEDRGKLRPRRQTHKATVHPPGGEPVLDLAVVAEQELIVDARIVVRECAQDVWQPVRGHARKRADADMARLQAVQRVHLRRKARILRAQRPRVQQAQRSMP